MKIFIYWLLICFSSFAQTNSKVFKVTDKPEEVFRGLDNPVTITIPGVDASKITVTGKGVRKGEGKGNYIITPRMEKEVKLTMSYRNSKNTLVAQEKLYVVRPFPMLEVLINKQYHPDNNYILNKEQLLKLDVGVILVPECSLFDKPTTAEFTIFILGYKHYLHRK